MKRYKREKKSNNIRVLMMMVMMTMITMNAKMRNAFAKFEIRSARYRIPDARCRSEQGSSKQTSKGSVQQSRVGLRQGEGIQGSVKGGQGRQICTWEKNLEKQGKLRLYVLRQVGKEPKKVERVSTVGIQKGGRVGGVYMYMYIYTECVSVVGF